jgi:peptide/nickel transport system substrate-binding protein
VEENWRAIGLDVTVQLREATFGFERVNTDLMGMWVWHGDARTETLFPAFINSHMFGTWPGICWLNWYNTEGATGEEPPPEILEVFEAFTNMQSSTSEEEIIRWGQVMLDNLAENVWTLATVNDFPHPMIVKNDIRNFPTEADGPLIYEWSTWWTNAYEPAQFYFEDRPAVTFEQSDLPRLYPVEELDPPVERALREGWL